jgi:hypothetical protein
MKLNLNISHNLKPEELAKFLILSQETNKPITRLILEAARELATRPEAGHDNFHLQKNKA